MPKVSLYTNEQKQLADVTVKEGVLENFANLSGKHLCWNLFLIKLPVSSLKRDFKTGVSCEICIIYKSIYFKKICERLLLYEFLIQPASTPWEITLMIFATYLKGYIYLLCYLKLSQTKHFPMSSLLQRNIINLWNWNKSS